MSERNWRFCATATAIEAWYRSTGVQGDPSLGFVTFQITNLGAGPSTSKTCAATASADSWVLYSCSVGAFAGAQVNLELRNYDPSRVAYLDDVRVR